MFEAETAHEKADIFQKMLLEKMNEIFPEKTRKLITALDLLQIKENGQKT